MFCQHALFVDLSDKTYVPNIHLLEFGHFGTLSFDKTEQDATVLSYQVFLLPSLHAQTLPGIYPTGCT